MEHRLHAGLQVPAHDGLSDPVRDSRHPEHPRAAVLLRHLHRTHRRGHVTPRREPIPELVEIPVKVPLELRDRLAVNTGRTLVRLHPPVGIPNGPLGDLKQLRLRLARTRLLPPMTVDRSASQDDPSPSLHPHYQASQLLRDGPPLHPASLLSPSRFQPLGVLAPDDQPQAITAPLAGRPIGAQVHTFRTRAQAKLAPPLCRTPSGPSAGTRQTHPGTAKNPRFRRQLFPFDTSSAVYSRSPS